MIHLAVLFLGAFYGWHRAGRRGGNQMDKLQYAAVFGIIAAILSNLAVIIAGFAGLI